MTKTPDEIANIANAVGFKGDGLVKAIAVALAESGGNERATNVNSDKWRSVDRGLWQINSHWHPEVSAAQAFNPATAARAAFRISKGGTDWSQWSTWPVAATVQMGRARLAAGPYLNVRSYPTPTTSTPTPTTGTGTQQAGFWDDAGKWLGRELGERPELVDPFDEPGKYLGRKLGENPDLVELPGDILSAPGDMLGAAAQAVALAAKGAAWIADAHNWKRIAFVIGGGAALLVGAQQLASSGALGSTAAGVGAIPGKAVGLIPAGKIAKAAGGTAAKAAKAVK